MADKKTTAPAPAHPAPAPPTVADYNALNAKLTAANNKVKSLTKDLADERAEVSRLNTALQAADTVKRQAQDQVRQLREQLDAAPEIVKAEAARAAAAGPKPHDPRWLYPADGKFDGVLFDDAAAADAAKKKQPDYWYPDSPAAQARYADLESQHLPQ